MAKSEIKSIVSMFSGVGGLDMGFEGGFDIHGKKISKLPFKVIAAYEKDEKCVTTFRLNLKAPIYQRELNTSNIDDIPQADLLIGGFPCQDFSSCGPKRGLDSERGKLFEVMVKYLEKNKPPLFCAENVPHLGKMDNGKILRHIINCFENAGYKVDVWNLYAPDYGVPQTRRRLFIVGVRSDIAGFPRKPIAKFENNHRTIKWAIDDLKTISDDSVHNQSQYFKASVAKRGNGQGDEKSSPDLPGYTVRANAKSRVHFHYELDRRLTVRECARLQTFPDTFFFPHSATANIMQIGNAVPPLLANCVAKQLANFFKSIEL